MGFVALVAVAASGYVYTNYIRNTPTTPTTAFQTPEEANIYVRFDMEAFDKIKANYWNKLSDADLAEHFHLSLQKALGTNTTLGSTTRAAVAQMLSAAFLATSSPAGQRLLAAQTVSIALQNLQPVTRSGLLSQAQVTQLSQEVTNVNPSVDLYQNLGLEKGAKPEAVDAAYKAKEATLAGTTSPEGKAQLKEVAYAHKVLTDTNSKSLYDQAQIEPTIFSHTLGKTLYLNITKIAPNTLREFALAVDAASTTPLDSLLIDLRGNIGGDLSFLQGFLGLFVGQNEYAFDLYHLGDYVPERTTVPYFEELGRFRQIALLTDNMTQSTAELTATTFKKFHLGVVVGGTTRGWGTVEQVIPMDTVIDPNTKYTMLLVSSITLREDNQPIESRGVTPNIDTSLATWRNELGQYFMSASLIRALKEEATTPPLK